jgi:hypothetical protein
MSRDQRARDNWALLHTAELAAQSGAPVAVAFNLVSCGIMGPHRASMNRASDLASLQFLCCACRSLPWCVLCIYRSLPLACTYHLEASVIHSMHTLAR